MSWLIWIGAAVTIAGVLLLVACIRKALKLRRSDATSDEAQKELQKLAAQNMAALALSAMGLMLVIIGLVFG